MPFFSSRTSPATKERFRDKIDVSSRFSITSSLSQCNNFLGSQLLPSSQQSISLIHSPSDASDCAWAPPTSRGASRVRLNSRSCLRLQTRVSLLGGVAKRLQVWRGSNKPMRVFYYPCIYSSTVKGCRILQQSILLNFAYMADLLECIRNIKQTYNKYGQFKAIVDQPATDKQQLEQKIRSMSVAFGVVADQNTQILRVSDSIMPIIEAKDRQLEVKEKEVRQYRQQLRDVLDKNEELSNYCRKLAGEYTALLNSMKENEEVALRRQASAYSKLKMMEGQVSFLRKSVLRKNGIANEESLSKIKGKSRKSSTKRKGKTGMKTHSTAQSRKSIINNLH